MLIAVRAIFTVDNSTDKLWKRLLFKRDDDDDDDNDSTYLDSTSGSPGSIINSNLIYEWTPIVANMTPAKVDNYIFEINSESTGLGFAPSYEILIFLSGNICNQPDNSSQIQLRVFYSFDQAVLTNYNIGEYETFNNGYLEALQISPIEDAANASSKNSHLYVSVRLWDIVNDNEVKADDPILKNLTSSTWNYRLSISENDLVYQWDSRSWVVVMDTDDTSALISTGNVTDDAKSYYNYTIYDPSLYDLYVYAYEDYTKFINNTQLSLCSIKNGNYIVSSVNSTSSTVPLEMLKETSLKIQKRIANTPTGVTEQFYITGLNQSTTYAAFLTKKIGKGTNLSDVGGVLFNVEFFTTKSTSACSLIFGLDFCKDNAYAVPSSRFTNNNKSQLAIEYDNIANALYANFSKALGLVACDAHLDARYSPIKTCEDCAKSYRDWICAVSIPRCSVESSDYYIYRDKNSNRNSYLDTFIKPVDNYYEILPCIDMCYSIVRDCPSVFGFACPDEDDDSQLLLQSYNVYKKVNGLETCNFIGNTSELTIHK